jgi:hypothetical protein
MLGIIEADSPIREPGIGGAVNELAAACLVCQLGNAQP